MITRCAALLILLLAVTADATPPEPTPLSKTAQHIRGHTRAEVIKALGPATWAAIPTDQGDFRVDPTTKALYNLYWANKPCAPVVVTFSSEHRAVSVDEGIAICGAQVRDLRLEPGPARSCSKPDRKAICTR